jgi:hypothetical protein
MDFDSASVRGNSIQVLADVIQTSERLIPDNLMDILSLHLNDAFVHVHQQATYACERVHVASQYLAVEMVARLHNLEKVYKPDDPFFCEHVIRAMLNVSANFPSLHSMIVTRFVLPYCHCGEYYVEKEMIEILSRYIRNYPQLNGAYLREALSFLGRHPRDRFATHGDSERSHIFSVFHDLPHETIKESLSIIVDIARDLLLKDVYGYLRIIELLQHNSLHEQATHLCQQLLKQLPSTKKHEGTLHFSQALARASEVEILVQANEIAAAIDLIDKSKDLYHEDKPSTDVHSLETFGVALQISEDIDE